MERIQIPEKLKQARRALDSLSQVKILDDWKFAKLQVEIEHFH